MLLKNGALIFIPAPAAQLDNSLVPIPIPEWREEMQRFLTQNIKERALLVRTHRDQLENEAQNSVNTYLKEEHEGPMLQVSDSYSGCDVTSCYHKC